MSNESRTSNPNAASATAGRLSRLAHVPLRNRFFHVANSLVVRLLGRRLGIVHVIEYPKCGGSWVRRLIQDSIGGSAYLSDRFITPNSVVQIHRLYKRALCNPVVVVRDPRDMYVSAYYHETKFEGRVKHPAVEQFYRHDPNRPSREDFAAYLNAKLTHETEPVYFYSQFLDAWLNRPGVCVIRYEDCLRDPVAQLIRILRFLRRPVHLDRISNSVEKNRFEQLTKRASGRARKPGESDPTQFARKGIAGDWKNHFNEETCRMLERFEGSSLRRLGYESDDSWIAEFLEQQEKSDVSRAAM